MDALLTAMPTMAAMGAATRPMVRSLSSDRRIAARSSSAVRSSDAVRSGGSSSGRTRGNFSRSQKVSVGSSPSPDAPRSRLLGTGEGYRSLLNGPFPPDFGNISVPESQVGRSHARRERPVGGLVNVATQSAGSRNDHEEPTDEARGGG